MLPIFLLHLGEHLLHRLERSASLPIRMAALCQPEQEATPQKSSLTYLLVQLDARLFQLCDQLCRIS